MSAVYQDFAEAKRLFRHQVIGDHILFNADCLSVLPLLGPVDAVVTDPPYGIAYQSGHATDALWGAGRRIANDKDASVRDAALAHWAGCRTPRVVFGSRKVQPPPETRMVLIWDKGPALGMGALDLPWKPSYEEIYILGGGYTGARDEGAVLYCPPVQSMAKNGRLHPNEKPITLLQRLFAKVPGDLILDPFAGSGTTGVACVREGRRFIGIELDSGYFDIACERIRKEMAQPRLDLPPPPVAKQEAMDL